MVLSLTSSPQLQTHRWLSPTDTFTSHCSHLPHAHLWCMLSSLQRGLTQATRPHLDWLLPPSPPGSPALLWHMTCTDSQSSICYLLLFKGKDRVIYKWPICVHFYGWIIFHCVYVLRLLYPFPLLMDNFVSMSWILWTVQWTLRCVFLNHVFFHTEWSQKEKNKYCILMHICRI